MSSSDLQTQTDLATGEGTVIKQSQGTYLVRSAERVIICARSSRLRKNNLCLTAAPTRGLT